MPIAVGKNPEKPARARQSWTRYFANNLSATIILMAVRDGKTVYKKDLMHQIGGFKLNSRPEIYLLENDSSLKDDEEATDVESSTIQVYGKRTSGDGDGLKETDGYNKKVNFRTISVIRRELPETSFGWPLLRGTTLTSWENLSASNSELQGASSRMINASDRESTDDCNSSKDENSGHMQELSLSSSSAQSVPDLPLLHITSCSTSGSFRHSEARELSVVQWVLNLPARLRDYCFDENEHKNSSLEAPRKRQSKLDLVLKLKLFGCKRFSCEALKRATHQFSPENLIGEGGCSNVYKGKLPGGKLVAVKVLKQYKEAWNDFSLEVDIMSSLMHKHITPLIGACIEDDYLILVYDFLSKGSLEESLHGSNKKSVLPWKIRFKVAIGIAEALNYLHNECFLPVVHRDVKTSNILLANEFQPQLSDFGLATWGPADSSYLIDTDIVGTFGYIAPEYIMHGRVSDKIDVYSFGVVLLELLTGKKPIYSKDSKQRENLVKWALPLLKNGNVKPLLDPRADDDFDIAQMNRMVLAITLCIRQSPDLRPKISQVLELLRGEKDEREWMDRYASDVTESSTQELDHSSPKFGRTPDLDFSFLDSDYDDASVSSLETTSSRGRVDERKHRLKLKDLLQEPQD